MTDKLCSIDTMAIPVHHCLPWMKIAFPDENALHMEEITGIDFLMALKQPEVVALSCKGKAVTPDELQKTLK